MVLSSIKVFLKTHKDLSLQYFSISNRFLTNLLNTLNIVQKLIKDNFSVFWVNKCNINSIFRIHDKDIQSSKIFVFLIITLNQGMNILLIKNAFSYKLLILHLLFAGSLGHRGAIVSWAAFWRQDDFRRSKLH